MSRCCTTGSTTSPTRCASTRRSSTPAPRGAPTGSRSPRAAGCSSAGARSWWRRREEARARHRRQRRAGRGDLPAPRAGRVPCLRPRRVEGSRGAGDRRFLGAYGGRAEAVVFDVTDGEAVRQAASAMLKNGPVQILVNNAGVHDDAPLAGMRFEQWSKVIDVTLTASSTSRRRCCSR